MRPLALSLVPATAFLLLALPSLATVQRRVKPRRRTFRRR